MIFRKLNLIISKLVLSKRIRERADKYFNLSIKEFRKRNKKAPNRNEIFLLVVKASHRTLGIKKAKGRKGHIKRQQIRRYLILKNNIRQNYKLQKPKK
ncbi:MAG: hypothetical protein V1491_02045 [archaeon]